jgi:DNA-binding IclR family transcriptional regulator
VVVAEKKGRTGSAAAAEASSPTLQGVSRALRVLDVVAQRPMRTTELSEELGISWATLQRTLAQLEADEFISRDERGNFHIGRKTWLLGSTYLVGHRLMELAVPLLTRESSLVPTSVLQLVERSGDTTVVLFSREAASKEVITRTTYGHHFPLHCGSKGWVFLANAEPEFVDRYLSEPLISLTPATVTDPDELRERLAEVREQGYAVTVGDVQSFTGSVAAPVFDDEGQVEACICAVSRRSSLTGDKQEQIVELVQRVAQTLSLGLGWQPLRHAKVVQRS